MPLPPDPHPDPHMYGIILTLFITVHHALSLPCAAPHLGPLVMRVEVHALTGTAACLMESSLLVQVWGLVWESVEKCKDAGCGKRY